MNMHEYANEATNGHFSHLAFLKANEIAHGQRLAYFYFLSCLFNVA